MTQPRYDKLGRRIPEYDRSEAIRKGNKTKKEKYGPDYHTRISADGGRARKRGYFGRLKDEGKDAELKALAVKGVKRTNAIKAEKRARKLQTEVRGTAPENEELSDADSRPDGVSEG